jgi:nitrogen-specific signal transduction histidine kinase
MIELEKDSTLPNVEHDSDQIHQLCLNLLLHHGRIEETSKSGTAYILRRPPLRPATGLITAKSSPVGDTTLQNLRIAARQGG